MDNFAAAFSLFFLPIPKPKWTARDLPDHTGKVVIVTGGNTGIGKETARALLVQNAKVYIACRSKTKAEAAIADLRASNPENEAQFLELDLSSFSSIEKAAQDFLTKEQRLHVLYNNAGVMTCPIHMVTSESYDLQFGTNVLGHFYFTQLLLPALFAASTPTEKARVITTSSSMAYFRKVIDLDTLKDGPKRRKLSTTTLYSQSKLGNVVIASELARRHGDKIVSISVHPGMISSDLHRYTAPIITWFFNKFIGYDTTYGAITQLYAGGAPEAVHYSGKFLIPWARLGTTPKYGDDLETGAKLWAWCEEQILKRD